VQINYFVAVLTATAAALNVVECERCNWSTHRCHYVSFCLSLRCILLSVVLCYYSSMATVIKGGLLWLVRPSGSLL